AFAALADTRAPVNIPFEFELRGQTLPAGRYEVTTSTSTGVVSLVDPNGRQHASLTMPLGNPNKVTDSKIVFLYDGETYLLSEVWLSDAGGRKVQQMKRKPAEISKRGVERRVEIAVGD
ncbi:MAG TPA: hypothetical protein DCY80_17440, partial [Solibacterales bacterium]|nr:hypothetical protein [Bryobacterales bacterium]